MYLLKAILIYQIMAKHLQRIICCDIFFKSNSNTVTTAKIWDSMCSSYPLSLQMLHSPLRKITSFLPGRPRRSPCISRFESYFFSSHVLFCFLFHLNHLPPKCTIPSYHSPVLTVFHYVCRHAHGTCTRLLN